MLGVCVLPPPLLRRIDHSILVQHTSVAPGVTVPPLWWLYGVPVLLVSLVVLCLPCLVLPAALLFLLYLGYV